MNNNSDLKNTNFGRMAVRNRFLDIKDLIINEKPIIIDGGANEGHTINNFLRYFPNAIIHAFEPITDCVKILENKFMNNKNITIHQNALGPINNEKEFYILKNRVSSSILKPTKWNFKYHDRKMDLEKKITVEQVKLDNYNFSTIDIVKLDLQGYELEALKGMENSLKITKIILTEVEFVPLYKNQSLFAEIDIFLRKNNFRLFNLYDLWTHQDGQLTSGDAIFVNNTFFKEN